MLYIHALKITPGADPELLLGGALIPWGGGGGPTQYLPPAYVVWREGTVFTGVCLLTFRAGGGGGGGVPGLSKGKNFWQQIWLDTCSDWGKKILLRDPPPRNSKKIAMATRRAVCLLRSRRRTFLFSHNFWKTYVIKEILVRGGGGGGAPPKSATVHLRFTSLK